MNLQELINKQRELDAKIVKDKGLEGQDLFAKKVLALLTELGEFANETRCFKYWSNDQEPRTSKYVLKKEYSHLHITQTGAYEYQLRDEFGNVVFDDVTDMHHDHKNPLLEEYIDGVHFFLSLAIDKGWEDHLYLYEEAIEETREKGLEGGLTGIILETQYWALKMYMENDKDKKIEEAFGYTKKEFCFKNAWYCFIATGMVGFNFTWEQIYEAYMEKNRVNHERQATGY